METLGDSVRAAFGEFRMLRLKYKSYLTENPIPLEDVLEYSRHLPGPTSLRPVVDRDGQGQWRFYPVFWVDGELNKSITIRQPCDYGEVRDYFDRVEEKALEMGVDVRLEDRRIESCQSLVESRAYNPTE